MFRSSGLSDRGALADVASSGRVAANTGAADATLTQKIKQLERQNAELQQRLKGTQFVQSNIICDSSFCEIKGWFQILCWTLHIV